MSLTGKDALKRPMNIHKTPVKGYGKRLCHYNESIDENWSHARMNHSLDSGFCDMSSFDTTMSTTTSEVYNTMSTTTSDNFNATASSFQSQQTERRSSWPSLLGVLDTPLRAAYYTSSTAHLLHADSLALTSQNRRDSASECTSNPASTSAHEQSNLSPRALSSAQHISQQSRLQSEQVCAAQSRLQNDPTNSNSATLSALSVPAEMDTSVMQASCHHEKFAWQNDSGFGDASGDSVFDRTNEGPMFDSSGELKTPLTSLKKSTLTSTTSSPLRSFIINESPAPKRRNKPTIDVRINGENLEHLRQPKNLLSFQQTDEASTSGVSSLSHESSILSAVETPSKNGHSQSSQGDEHFDFLSISPIKTGLTENFFNTTEFDGNFLYDDDFAMANAFMSQTRSPLKTLSPNKNNSFGSRSVTKRPASALNYDFVPKKPREEIGQMTYSKSVRLRVPYLSSRFKEVAFGKTKEQKDLSRQARRFLSEYPIDFNSKIPLFKSVDEFNNFNWDYYESRYGNDRWKKREL